MLELTFKTAAYAVMAIFTWRVAWRIYLWGRGGVNAQTPAGSRSAALMRTAVDILFLPRLLEANPLLWIGEWTFHASFAIVTLRHLRFILNPVPEWIVFMQPLGVLAGYMLPVSLIYIVTVRNTLMRDSYYTSSNLLLTTLALIASASGLALHALWRTDAALAKAFVLGLFTFESLGMPSDAMFLAHLLAAFAFIAIIPSHIMAAPIVLYDSNLQREAMASLVHDDTC